MLVLRVVAFLGGAVVAVGVVASAMKTVVVPRAEPSFITRGVFQVTRVLFELRVRRKKTWVEADRIMARYAPTSLMLLPLAWVVLEIAAFTPMYWAAGIDFPRDAVTYSGSALLTLGFAFRDVAPVEALTFMEAAVGLGLVALLISFLPTMYSQFSRREVLVARLETQAGTPPSPAELFQRAQTIGWLPQLDDLWLDWERWFIEVEESHTSFPALNFFRSPHHGRSWITAAGCVLDAASLRASTLDQPRTYRAELCIRAGALTLRHIADFYEIAHDSDPAPDDAIAIAREEFDEVCTQLVASGVELVDDLDQAWRDFAGWRVNYDKVLLSLCALTMAPYALWSSDRSPTRVRPPMVRRNRS